MKTTTAVSAPRRILRLFWEHIDKSEPIESSRNVVEATIEKGDDRVRIRVTRVLSGNDAVLTIEVNGFRLYSDVVLTDEVADDFVDARDYAYYARDDKRAFERSKANEALERMIG
jgi:hypothetical protein